MEAILNALGITGISASLILFLMLFIEITPVIHLNPIGWIGNRLFGGIYKRIDDMTKKLDGHIVQGYRKDILDFQNECLRDVKHTREQFKNVFKSIDEYETYIKQNKIKNGEVEQAMEYIKRVYQRCLDQHDFLDITQLN